MTPSMGSLDRTTLVRPPSHTEHRHDSDNVTVVTDDATSADSGEPVQKKRFSDRLLRTPKGPSPSDYEPPVEILPFSQRLAVMRSLGPSEVRFGYGVSALGLMFALGLNLPYMFGTSQYTTTQKPTNGHCAKDFLLIKGQCSQTVIYHPSDYIPFLLIGLVLVIALVVTVRLKRRVPATFTALLMGLVVASQPPIRSFILGAPFWIYGGWLLLRARRIQKFGTVDAKTTAAMSAKVRAAKKAGTAMPAEVATRQDLTDASPSSRGGSKTASKAKGGGASSANATPSKRYTPKKAAPKRPPPPPEEPKPSRFRRLIGDDEPADS